MTTQTVPFTKDRKKLARKALSAAICAAALSVSGIAFSQDTDGVVRGSVQGAGATTVVEVVDTARGTTRTEATGANGDFRIGGLNPGQYEVRVLQNGSVVDTLTVNVSIGAATEVNMATTQQFIEQIVTTGRRQAAIDTSIAESGLVISTELLLEMPVKRDLTSVALLAPGTSAGDNRFGNLASFGGASVAENTAFINGLNTTNFRTGVGFSRVPFEFYDTLQIKTGGYSAKYGRSLGGVMNATAKSGTNDWDFGFNAYYNDELEHSPNTFAAANELDKKTSVTGDVYLSGPIIRDRLFFYALYSDDDREQRYAGIQSERDYDFNQDEGFWGVKLDGYITPDHHIEYTHFTDERTGIETVYGFDGTSLQRGSLVGDTLYEAGGENWIATYTGQFGDDLEVSFSYGENEANRTTAPASAAIPVVYEYNGGFSAIGEWSNFFVSEGFDTREMTRADITWTGFSGHELSLGIDNEDNFSDEATVNSGGVYWLRDPLNTYNLCSPAECPQGANARRRNYSVGGSFETNSESWYIQDIWEVNENLTLELGLRNESFKNLNAQGGVFVEVDDQWAPRLSAVYDPNADGRSKFFANYGEYYLPIAANTNIRMAGNETYIHDYYDWDGVSVDGQGVPTGLGPLYDTIVYGDGSVPDTRSVTDANLDAMFQEEYILGYQMTLDNGMELGIKGIFRELGTTIEDVAIDAAVIDYYNNGAGNWTYGGGTVEQVFSGFHQYVLTNPGAAMNVYIPENDEVIDLTAAQLGYPEAEREYKAIELTWSRPFADNWSADVSYTWSKSEGNHEGYVKSDNAQDDAGITQNFDQPGLVDFSYGRLPNDRTHTLKAWGTYEFNNGIRVSGNYLIQSGRPISCFGAHPTDVFAQAYGASSHFCQGEAVGRGDLGRTPTITNMDLNVQYDLEIANTDVLLSLDLFNVFNSAKKIRVSETADTFSGAPEPDFLKASSYQLPRAVRLSARFNF
ncbi:MAG: TonB-dependent receptor [Gammaproteobacteria bacterium]|nr:TonB-dependent receptor [Gammaproteobacteria bacterium]